ncbi:MAG: hypothetical protein ACI9NC_004097, partial [Verrucomicrobiales bacterium]
SSHVAVVTPGLQIPHTIANLLSSRFGQPRFLAWRGDLSQIDGPILAAVGLQGTEHIRLCVDASIGVAFAIHFSRRCCRRVGRQDL